MKHPYASSMAAGALAVLAGVLLLSACGVATESVEGRWVFVEFSVDGEARDVMVGENTSQQPWIELDSGSIRGSSGCNSFSGGYRYVDGSLELGGGGTLMWCGDESGRLMEFERAFSQLMGEPLLVSWSRSQMTWTGPSGTWTLEADAPTGGE